MAYCGPRGLPLSAFLDWPVDDQDAALAWQAHEGRRCASCGTHPDDEARHVHVDICSTCVQVEARARGEEALARGAKLRLAAGPVHQCSRCSTDATLT